MLGKISITDLSGKSKEINIYDIEEVKEGKGGGFQFTFGGPVEGEEPKECRKIIFRDSKGEKKTINTNESIADIRSKIEAARNNEDFKSWLDSIVN